MSTRPDIALLSRCREACSCDFCKFPVEIQGELCNFISLSVFARVRALSRCWDIRFQLFGPGKGVIVFGRNETNQLGDGNTTDRLSPVALTGPHPLGALRLQQIATGFRHTLALTPQGEVYAWGWNLYGQLGDGTRGTAVRLVPVRVDGELSSKRVIQVGCGRFHSLALTDQGEVYAWGRNEKCQLGDGTRREVRKAAMSETVATRAARVDMNGGPVTHISVGDSHNLALTSTGEVYGWGEIFSGPFGESIQFMCPNKIQIESLPSDERVVRVVAGTSASYALTDQGHLYSCELNSQRVPLPHRIVQVEASAHVLALTDQGEVYAWGSSLLGDGTTHIIRSPMQVGGPLAHRRVTQIAVGYSHSLAVTDQGEIFGWGYNAYGQLGDGTKEDRHTPHLLPCSSMIGRARNLRIAATYSTFLWAP